jgi:Cu(I)/Ag(I) efflux system membrane fusion protein
MKKSILIAVLAVSLVFTFSACNNSTPKSAAVESTTATKEVYTCTMHNEVRSNKPGDCPKCGMKLVLLDSSDTTHMHNLSDTTHIMN